MTSSLEGKVIGGSNTEKTERQAFWHPHDVARDLMQKRVFLSIKDTHELLMYEPDTGCYEQYAAEYVIKKCREYKLSKINMRTGGVNEVDLEKADDNEVIYYIQSSTQIDRELLKGAIDGEWLHVKNGWLNMDTGAFFPHTSERLSTSTTNARYSRHARAHTFIRVLREALMTTYREPLTNKVYESPDYIIRLLKVLGNILIEDCRYEKATLFVGEGHNRKGTLIHAVENALGEKNCAHVSVQETADDKFATSDLFGKMLNSVADLNADRISKTGIFKMLVSGDTLRAQKKNQPAFNFRSKAKHLYSGNEIPASSDQTHAYFRRWEIIPFYRIFEREPDLYEKLGTDEEMSGILNLMLKGRRILLEEGFDETSIEKIRMLYNKNASVCKEFLDHRCVINPESQDVIRTANLQQEFCSYLEEKRGKKLTDSEKNYHIRQLGEELNKLGVENKYLREAEGKKSGKTREHYYVGIRLKGQQPA